jgi:hypothetical protein
LYHKIRLPLEEVQRLALTLAATVERARASTPELYNSRLVWDIRLSTVTDVLAQLRSDSCLLASERIDLLQREWPRFIWCVSAEHDGKKVLECFLDATDIPGGAYVLLPRPRLF